MKESGELIIIGGGAMANVYSRSLVSHVEAQYLRINALVDPNPDHLEFWAQNYEKLGGNPSSVSFFPDIQRLKEQVDCTQGRVVFLISTPPETHLEITEEIIAAGGKNLIIEKPLAVSNSDISRFISLDDISGLNLAVQEQYYYSGNYMAASRFLEKDSAFLSRAFNLTPDEIGSTEIVCVNTESSKNRRVDSLVRRRNLERPLIFNYETPHPLSFALDFLPDGEIESVFTRDMVGENGEVISQHAEGQITLSHGDKLRSQHYTNFEKEERVRMVQFEFSDGGSLTCYFDVGICRNSPSISANSNQPTSKIVYKNAKGDLFSHDFSDNSVGNSILCLSQDFMEGRAPISSIKKAARVSSIIETAGAMDLAGVEAGKREIA